MDLDPVDMNILLHLIRHWWRADRLPYPTKRTIAECMRISPSTVQRRIASMEKRGLLVRGVRSDQRGQLANEYDISGLIRRARPFADEKIEEKGRRRKADNSRRLNPTLTRKQRSPGNKGVGKNESVS